MHRRLRHGPQRREPDLVGEDDDLDSPSSRENLFGRRWEGERAKRLLRDEDGWRVDVDLHDERRVGLGFDVKRPDLGALTPGDGRRLGASVEHGMKAAHRDDVGGSVDEVAKDTIGRPHGRESILLVDGLKFLRPGHTRISSASQSSACPIVIQNVERVRKRRTTTSESAGTGMSELREREIVCGGCGERGTSTEILIEDEDASTWTGFPSGWLVLDTKDGDEELACSVGCTRKVMSKRRGYKQMARAAADRKTGIAR